VTVEHQDQAFSRRGLDLESTAEGELLPNGAEELHRLR
jgi:hypothetical protein